MENLCTKPIFKSLVLLASQWFPILCSSDTVNLSKEYVQEELKE